MGYKKVCVECRKAYSIRLIEDRPLNLTCPECGLKVVIVNHKFRPPKREDIKQWDLVKFLVEHGFHFGHVSDNYQYVPYPTTMEEAKIFVVKYKSQAYFPKEAQL
jgi:DNA-directed RNA polymerase subunit RPC12/RpoP